MAQGRYADESNWLAHTRVKIGASIGARAVICPDLTIGAYASIAAGTVVTANVDPFQLVAGNPGRVIGRVDEGGRPISVDETS